MYKTGTGSTLLALVLLGGCQLPQWDVPALIEQLKSPERAVSFKAESDLKKLGPAAHPAVPFFMQRLTSRERVVRVNSFSTLECIVSKENVPYLISQLYSEHAVIRAKAAYFLGTKFAAEARPAETRLIELLDDPDPDVRDAATQCLGALKSKAAAGKLRELQNAPARRGMAATQALAQIGDGSSMADLRVLLDDENADLFKRAEAARTLGNVHDRGAAASLVRALSSPYEMLRVVAAEALGKVSAPEAAPALIAAYRRAAGNSNGHLRSVIAASLGNLQAKEAVSLLREAMHDEYNCCNPPVALPSCYCVRKAASEALDKITGVPH